MTSSDDVLDTIKWGYDMVSTYIAFKEDDMVAVLEALEVRQMPQVWYLGDMCVMSRSGPAVLKVESLRAAGVSFNYASYNTKESMVPAKAGQIRFGHDGTEMDQNLVPDPPMAAVYSKFLPGENRLNDTERLRICYVCCGQSDWETRHANGQMHKMRRLLSQ